MYGKGHLSSTTRSKCLLCNKSTSTFVEMSRYCADGSNKIGCSIHIPICEEHYNSIDGEFLAAHAKLINSTFRKLFKIESEV